MEFPDSDPQEQESILLSVSTASVITGNACQQSHLFRIKFYGPFDKPLGRYLQDDLFEQTKCCESCGEPNEAHIRRYIHHQGNITINVRRVPSLKLEGENDGKIWAWHRCLMCGQIDGVPSATRRAVMSDADLGLSFGKFLESFSNYANTNHLASCGHSLQNCLQYYGFGRMVVFFQYSTVEIFSVCLSLSTLDFNVSATSILSDGARLMVPQNSNIDIVIVVCENEPTSIISYALTSKEYEDQIRNASDVNIESSESFWDTSDLDIESFESWAALGAIGSISVEPKTSPHIRISFRDESPNDRGKVMFSVTCYFAKQFEDLRKRCCIGELDFIRSLSRCSALGGKNNAYFAKSLNERFIIKQVTKTEFESFEEFAPEYFKHLRISLSTGTTICLTIILGIYQVTIKHLNEDDKEIKLDLMVTNNLFFKRKISKAYSIKDFARSHCISNIADANEVLLDMNISETIPSIPIILGYKAKKTLQRAVWNDTVFLDVNVTDYSLLVGVDEERQELVVGIIDFMTQYTSGKDLETWIKAFSILGGTENAPIICPQTYRRRFRKAVNASFPFLGPEPDYG